MTCINRKLLAVWGVLECLLFSGAFFGWGSLTFVLKDEGIWGDLCDSQPNGNKSLSFQPDINGSTPTSGYSILGSTPADIVVVIGDDDHVVNNSFGDNSTYPGPSGGLPHACILQDERFQLAFTIGSVSLNFGVFLVGQINYKFGMRTGRIVVMIVFLIGSVSMAFVTKGREWLLFVGGVGLSVGGISLLVSNAQITSLFAKGGSILMGIMSGSTDSSVLSMLLVKILFENGVARMHSFIFISSLFGVMVLFSTVMLLPKSSFNRKQEPEEVELSVENLARTNMHNDNDTGDSKYERLIPGKSRPERHKKQQTQSLKSCLFSGQFIFHTVWHFLLQLRFMYFMGTINPLLNQRLNNDHEKVSHYTNVGFYTLMSGILFSMLSGILYDWQINSHKKHPNEYERKLKPSVLPLVVTCCLATMMSICILIPTEEMIYIVFLLVAMYRSILYTMTAAYLLQVFPVQYFPAVYGICVMIAGILNFLQYAVFTWNESYPGAHEHVNIFFLGAVLLSFSHPIYQFLLCRKKRDLHK